MFTAVFILFVGGATSFLIASGRYDINSFIALAIVCAFFVVVHIQQYGYRVAWDQTSLYMRKWGLLNGLNIRPEISKIDWANVSSVKANFEAPLSRGGDFLPHEVIEIKSKTRGNARIPLYPSAMNPEDFDELITFMRDVQDIEL